jgi:hypothetical protein
MVLGELLLVGEKFLSWGAMSLIVQVFGCRQ